MVTAVWQKIIILCVRWSMSKRWCFPQQRGKRTLFSFYGLVEIPDDGAATLMFCSSFDILSVRIDGWLVFLAFRSVFLPLIYIVVWQKWIAPLENNTVYIISIRKNEWIPVVVTCSVFGWVSEIMIDIEINWAFNPKYFVITVGVILVTAGYFIRNRGLFLRNGGSQIIQNPAYLTLIYHCFLFFFLYQYLNISEMHNEL